MNYYFDEIAKDIDLLTFKPNGARFWNRVFKEMYSDRLVNDLLNNDIILKK